jgi:dolichol-phosphate mannosyltransferase
MGLQERVAKKSDQIGVEHSSPLAHLASVAGLALAPAAQLSIIVPTFNECDNVLAIIAGVSEALRGIAWEIVFVDDNSPDDTASFIRQLAQVDARIRCLHRLDRRGLSSACVEGIMSTASPVFAVMDADGQHDEQALRRMFDLLTTTEADLAVGSRYVQGGGISDWDANRAAMSRYATRIANAVAGTKLSDPMSGFFMMRRDAFLAAAPKLSSVGFKILLDIAVSSNRPLKIVDVPYQFRARQRGESKLDAMALWEFLLLLLDKKIGRYVPVRFISFGMIGSIGVIVHLAALALQFKILDIGFVAAQAAATFTAITSNFLLNNLLTYRDQRLTGKRLLLGWVSFNLICMTGAVANVGVASWIYSTDAMWLPAGLVGIVIGFVWNYSMSSMFTWNRK